MAFAVRREARLQHAVELAEAVDARDEADQQQAEAEHFRLIYEKEAAEAVAARAEADTAKEEALIARATAEKERAEAEAARAALLTEQELLTSARSEAEALRAQLAAMKAAEVQRLQDEADEAERLAAMAQEEQVPMSEHITAVREGEARAKALNAELATLNAEHERVRAMYVAAKTANTKSNTVSSSGMPKATGTVFCTIVGCDNLLVADKTSSDPFTAIWFGDEEQILRMNKKISTIPKKPAATDGTVNSGWCRTQMVKSTITPDFSADEFEFRIGPDLSSFPKRNMHLHIRVLDYDRITNSDILGEYDIDLCQAFGEDWNKYTVEPKSDPVELVDYKGKVKTKYVKRKVADLVDIATNDKTNSQCDLKRTLLDKTIYGRLTFKLRFQPDK
jgi:hypothetical protein